MINACAMHHSVAGTLIKSTEANKSCRSNVRLLIAGPFYSLLYLTLIETIAMQKISLSGFLLLACTHILFCSSATKDFYAPEVPITSKGDIKTGADQTEKYLPYLKGKRVGILGNQTTVIGKTHLVDSLRKLQVNIIKVFGPEHGFRVLQAPV